MTTKYCVVCRIGYPAYEKRHKRSSRVSFKRRYDSITCSKKCSREYGVLRYKKGWKPFVKENEK